MVKTLSGYDRMLIRNSERIRVGPAVEEAFQRLSKLLSDAEVPVRIRCLHHSSWSVVALAPQRALTISGGVGKELTMRLMVATEEKPHGDLVIGNICSIRIMYPVAFYGYEYGATTYRDRRCLIPEGLPRESEYRVPRSLANEERFLDYVDILARYMVQRNA